MSSIPSKIKKTFTQQSGNTDCGVACLHSIMRYYGGDISKEMLRINCGTGAQGTTLAGLNDAAEQAGFRAAGFKADRIEQLEGLTGPAILHVISATGYYHYVVLYKKTKSRWLIGDPAVGIKTFTSQDLEQIWKSKVLLTITPDKALNQQVSSRNTWLTALLRKDTRILVTALLLGAVVGILGLILAMVMQRLIDDLLPNRHQDLILVTMGILTILLLFKALLNYLRNLLLLSHHINFNRDLIKNFFNRLYHLPVSFFKSRSAGEIVARISDSKKIQKVVQLLIGAFVVDILVTALVLIGIAWYSISIALVVSLVLILFVVLLISFNRVIYQAHQKVMAAFSRRESVFIETIKNIIDIKTNNAAKAFSERSSNAHKSFQDQMFRLGSIDLKCGLGSELLGILLLILPMLMGSIYVTKEQLLLGEWVAILFLLSGIAPGMSRLVLFNTHLKEAKVAAQRLHEIWSVSLEINSEKEAQQFKIETLEIIDLQFGFPGQKALLQNLSFNICPNELTVLVGKSGSGKTTILDILQKQLPANSGHLLVNNTDLNKWSLHQWRNHLSVVPQKVNLFDVSLSQNISLELSEQSSDKVRSFCESIGMHNHLGSLSSQYDSFVGTNGLQLSGGEAQLVAWARALYRKPQVLLLDEATSFLDLEKKAYTLELLHRIKQHTLILMVSHDPHVIAQADKIIEL